ncbi:hypothetical protein [aff. Roholtiella sp. LEGE 12411]|uniref:hypothetical protein n=1 Tax=aff. Roholtiella sp. LEGE 12411 TaxID=1828822 RepID=UPI00187F18A2|nr:hypothetical protein [aff. Roholtiella sp. LEGE 12411]MBE9035265.1 hypothetical protein [aff. Roholtiella sp. LEGE 12411]
MESDAPAALTDAYGGTPFIRDAPQTENPQCSRRTLRDLATEFCACPLWQAP